MSSLPDTKFWVLLVGGLATVLIARQAATRRRRNPLGLPPPPGPKGQLLVGNVAQIPKDQAWLGYHEICREHGDIVRLNVLGTEILVLDSIKHASALLEKRAVSYSDRPDMAFLHLSELDWGFSVMPYGDEWRHHRRTFHQYFNQNAVPKYRPIAYEERDAFLRRLKHDPSVWLDHVQSFFGMTIMRTTYGFDDMKKNTAFIHSAEILLQEFGEAKAPGKYLVNSFPVLKHVPAWLPGAGWKRYMTGLAKLSSKVLNAPFEDAKAQLAKGEREKYRSVAAELIDRLPSTQDPDHDHAETVAKAVCGLAYIAGAESSTASGMAFVAALANNPRVQKKAQEELDAVVGCDRQPLITDRPDLPYLHAVVKELGRWYTAAPLGVVHSSSEDDEYEGYFIPKGTLIFPNAWAMMHDPATFDRPYDFYPERYLKDGKVNASVPDGELAAFGFGRRICPGRHFSHDVIFLFAASLLANFDISPRIRRVSTRGFTTVSLGYNLKPYHSFQKYVHSPRNQA